MYPREQHLRILSNNNPTPTVQSTAATREREKKQSGFSGNASTVLGVEEARGAERRREAFHTHRHKDTARTLHLVVSRVEEDRRRCVEVLLINHPFTNRVGRLSGDTTDGLPSMHAACLMPASVRFWHVRFDGRRRAEDKVKTPELTR